MRKETTMNMVLVLFRHMRGKDVFEAFFANGSKLESRYATVF